jgi:DNA modification methylase
MSEQIGLEPTPQEFIAKLVEVFREVRRVLRVDGTAWVNMGDSYAGSWGAQARPNGATGQMANRSVTSARQIEAHPRFEGRTGSVGKEWGMKPKDKMLIPHRLAIALCDDGWYVRDDIVWAKPNPMPESVTDRCTKAHEYIFLLSKSPRYYYDADAIAADSLNPADDARRLAQQKRGNKSEPTAQVNGLRPRSARDSFKREESKRAEVIPNQTVGTHRPDRPESEWDLTKRNKRSVWTVATQPFKEAHFATFPPALIEPCILAGCPVGGVVLDPFGGAGTTGLVADRLQRDAILIELNPAYADMARKRIQNDSPLFAEVA